MNTTPKLATGTKHITFKSLQSLSEQQLETVLQMVANLGSAMVHTVDVKPGSSETESTRVSGGSDAGLAFNVALALGDNIDYCDELVNMLHSRISQQIVRASTIEDKAMGIYDQVGKLNDLLANMFGQHLEYDGDLIDGDMETVNNLKGVQDNTIIFLNQVSNMLSHMNSQLGASPYIPSPKVATNDDDTLDGDDSDDEDWDESDESEEIPAPPKNLKSPKPPFKPAIKPAPRAKPVPVAKPATAKPAKRAKT